MRSFYKVDMLNLIAKVLILTAQCPECNYIFSDKEDFMKYSAVGEIIQCPVCKTELRLNNRGQLVAVDLKDLNYGE
jgi:C4-type Zn-finger protein